MAHSVGNPHDWDYVRGAILDAHFGEGAPDALKIEIAILGINDREVEVGGRVAGEGADGGLVRQEALDDPV